MVLDSDFDLLLASYPPCPTPVPPQPLLVVPASSTAQTTITKTSTTYQRKTRSLFVTDTPAHIDSTTPYQGSQRSLNGSTTVKPSRVHHLHEQHQSLSTISSPHPRITHRHQSKKPYQSPHLLSTSATSTLTPIRSSTSSHPPQHLPKKPNTPVPHPILLQLHEQHRHSQYETNRRKWMSKRRSMPLSAPSKALSNKWQIPEHLKELFK